jgi:transcriptional regulator with XRE-family HTH domain
MSSSSFGARLRQLREKAGLSQRELAERAGMHQFGVAKLEQGSREPAWATVQALAGALGVNCLAFSEEDGQEVIVPEMRKPGRPPRKETRPQAAQKARKKKRNRLHNDA